MWWALVDRHTVDFDQTRHALQNLLQGGTTEVFNALLLRQLGQFHGVGAFHDGAPHVLVNRHHLVNADPALVPGAAAGVATLGVVKRQIFQIVFHKPFLEQFFAWNVDRLFALLAQAACKPLGDDQRNGGRDVVGRNPHVEHAGQGLGCVVRMQC